MDSSGSWTLLCLICLETTKKLAAPAFDLDSLPGKSAQRDFKGTHKNRLLPFSARLRSTSPEFWSCLKRHLHIVFFPHQACWKTARPNNLLNTDTFGWFRQHRCPAHPDGATRVGLPATFGDLRLLNRHFTSSLEVNNLSKMDQKWISLSLDFGSSKVFLDWTIWKSLRISPTRKNGENDNNTSVPASSQPSSGGIGKASWS